MSRTFIRQDTQIRNSDLYDDTLAAGAALESGQTTIEGDLNALRSQVKRMLGETDWYTALSGRSLAVLSTDLADVEGHRLLRKVQVLTDISVTAAQNWEILSVAGSEAPTQVAAVASTVNGAVVAQSALNGAGFDVHELIEVAGQNAISPKNLCIVRDSTTGQVIQSSGRDVFALLQYESTGVDGAAFNDTSAGNRVKLSFVRLTSGLDDLEACPVGDIAGKTINYVYVARINLDALPEDSYLNGTFLDQAASVDVTLDRAIDNQSGAATQAQDIDINITDTFAWAFRDPSGARDILKVTANAGNDAVEIDADTFDVNNVNTADFLNGVTVDSGGTPINLGVTAGQIDGSALTVASAAATDLTLRGTREMFLDDGNQTGSTWAQTGGIKLSDTTAEWDAFEAAYGEVSLLSAITTAKNSAVARGKTVGVVTGGPHNADVNITGAGGSPNLDAQLGDYSTKTFTTDVDVFLNGVLMRNGADASANHDVYPGTSAANGDLKFEFKLKTNDVITMIIW